MDNFNYYIPTEVFFGRGEIKNLGREIGKYGSRVLLCYGGGSIKKIGLYQRVIKELKEKNIEYIELGGIEPNPRIELVRKGIDLVRKHKLDFILAVGGGSTIDTAKVVAAGYYYQGDPWDLLIKKAKVENALPIGTILTLAATGSEMDQGAVISNLETKEKYSVGHRTMFPKFSIMDPEYTFTVSKYQTASGVVDIMSHTFESYFSNIKTAYIQDRLAEAILKTCIEYGPIAIEQGDNYEARANLMWASSLAINGLIGYGKDSEWSVHPLEHELSAYYDITHGVGLGILTPNWMEYVLDETNVEKFVEYGVNVWEIDKSRAPFEIAKLSIEKTRDFFNSLGLPSSLREVGIGEENIENMAEDLIEFKKGPVGNFKALNYNDIIEIYRRSL